MMAAPSRAAEFVLAADNLPAQLQERLALAKAGDRIVLPAGRFRLDSALLVMQRYVRLVGQGSDKTILDFGSARDGGQSILVRAHGVEITGVTVMNSPSDGVVLRGVDGARIADVRVAWERGLHEKNGGYGIYPVQSKNVLIERCNVSGATEAGIYVGQTIGAEVRHNHVEDNSVGIDIENSHQVSIADNTMRDNGVGLTVTSLPYLLIKRTEGVRIGRNRFFENAGQNLSPASALASVLGRGQDIVIVAAQDVSVDGNWSVDRDVLAVRILDFAATGRRYKGDAQFSSSVGPVRLLDVFRSVSYDGGVGDAHEQARYQISLVVPEYKGKEKGAILCLGVDVRGDLQVRNIGADVDHILPRDLPRCHAG